MLTGAMRILLASILFAFATLHVFAESPAKTAFTACLTDESEKARAKNVAGDDIKSLLIERCVKSGTEFSIERFLYYSKIKKIATEMATEKSTEEEFSLFTSYAEFYRRQRLHALERNN